MYSKAQLTPEQRKKFESLASMVSKYVPISELATRGFCMMATVEWQKKHSQTVSAIGQESPQERIAVMKEIAKELGAKLKQILQSKGKEKLDLVDEGIRKVIEIYTKAFAK